MAKKRDQLCPVWLTALLGAGITLALAASFTTEESLSRRVASSPPSDLSVAYLEGLLRIRPDSPLYLNALAMQHIKLGHWESAFQIADRLQSIDGDESAQRQALLLQTIATEQWAYGYAQMDPRRAEVLERVRLALEKAIAYDWDVETLVSLANKAEEVGAHQIVERLYSKLAQSDSPHAQRWHEKLAEVALSRNGDVEAAKAYIAAFHASRSIERKRHFFFSAMNTLVAANKVNLACDLGHANLGTLQSDRATIRYMLTLARQAQRNDLVAFYARALLPLIPPTQPALSVTRSPVNYLDSTVIPSGQAKRYKIALDASPMGEKREQASEFTLVYEAFVETGLLAEAEAAGRQALEAGEPVNEWAPRLAQLAMWQNQRDKALEYWLMVAKAQNDAHAWEEVLALAPELERPDVYMQAWQFLHADRTGPDANWQAQEDLLVRYIHSTRWESALELADVLMESIPEEAIPRLMLLRVAAAEQIVYQHEADDPDRQAAIKALRDRLDEAAHYDFWGVPSLTWLAHRAEIAGAGELHDQWIKTLIEQDGDNAVQWQVNIAESALRRGEYTRSADAYFSAQAMAKAPAEKREYFIAGLQAYLASGDVNQACNAAERHRQELAGDPQTLRYLIGLARQAGRADLLAAYARELIQATQKPQDKSVAKDDARPVSFYPRHSASMGVWRVQPAVWTGNELPIRTAIQWSDIQPRHVMVLDASGASPKDSAGDLESDLNLAFEALMQSQQFDEAEKTAELALKQGLDRAVWLRRLAQVSEWNRKAEKALHYWLQYARESGDQVAWQKVAVMAKQLNNDSAFLAAAQQAYARNPSDPALLNDLVTAYEKLGRVEQGMQYLRRYAGGSQRQSVLEAYAFLALRTGRDALALETYGQLLEENPGTPSYAMQIAAIHQRLGNKQDAIEALRNARGHVGTDAVHAPFWRIYAALARNLRLDDEAHFAHQQLIATGTATADDLRDVTYFYGDYPVDAGRVAEAEFRKNGASAALQAALQFYSQSRAWPYIGELLDELTPEQRATLERSPDMLAARATYYTRKGDYDSAFNDMRKAAHLPNASDQIRVAYLWALSAFGSIPELRSALMEHRGHASSNPLYWGPFGAGELRLGNAEAAARYLRQEAKRSGQHPIILASLADAEEAAGRAGLAHKLRQDAWKQLQNDPVAEAPADKESLHRGIAEAQSRRVAAATLGHGFMLGDEHKAMVFQLLQEELAPKNEQVSRVSVLGDLPGLTPVDAIVQPDHSGYVVESEPVFRDGGPPLTDSAEIKALILHWSLVGQHNELAREWLVREYDEKDPSRIDAQAYMAAEGRNIDLLESLVESDRLSPQAKLNSLIVLNRIPEAQPIAYALAEGAPDNDERHAQMTELLMRTPQSLGVNVAHVSADPLEYLATTLDGRIILTSRFSIGVEALHRRQKTTDETNLAWVPRNDRSFNAVLTDLTAARELALNVGHRKSTESFYTVSFMAKLNPFGSFRPQILIGRNQPTYVSQTLQVGGVKDLARVTVDWTPPSPWFVHGSFEAMRFYTQDRERLGHGYVFNTEAGWRLPALLPDLHVRGVFERGVFSARDTLVGGFSRFSADGQAPSASFVMPQNYTRYGLILGYGPSDSYSYGARWRPYADLGIIHDSNQGWGPLVAIGVTGPVLGPDRLSLFFQYENAAGDGTRSSRQFGLNYRFYF